MDSLYWPTQTGFEQMDFPGAWEIYVMVWLPPLITSLPLPPLPSPSPALENIFQLLDETHPPAEPISVGNSKLCLRGEFVGCKDVFIFLNYYY